MVDKFAEFISFIGHNFIQGIFISVLLLIVTKLTVKEKVETYFSSQILRWIIIFYSFCAIISTMLLLIFEHSKEYAFLNRATGPYWWAYLLLLVTNCVLPLILLNKKIGIKLRILFIIALLMNLGWLFESFVIHITSFHRDYMTENDTSYLPNQRELKILLRGLYIGIITLIIGNVFGKYNEIRKLNKE
jgi:hypothetical protein